MMNAQRFGRLARRGAFRLLLLPLATGAWTGCAGFDPAGTSMMGKDIVEIRQLVNQLKEEEAASRRTLDYRLGTLEEKAASKNDMLTTNVSSLEKQIAQQSEEIRSLRKELGEMAFMVNTLTTKLDMKAAKPSEQSSEMLATTAPAGDQAYAEAEKQFNLGRYDLARQGFEGVLAQNPTGDLAVRAQYWLAESCYRQPDLRAAYDNYSTLVRGNSSHPLAWKSVERLAEINSKLGRKPEALKLYNEIIKNYPGYEGIDRVKESVRALQEGSAAATPAPTPAAQGTTPPQGAAQATTPPAAAPKP